MKHLLGALILAFCFLGCSKTESDSSVSSSQVVAKDLGKDTKYFTDLYGPATSQKSVGEFAFSLPGVGHLINLTGPFAIQQFSSGKLSVAVIFPEASSQAVWVKYTLPNPWTDDQIKAALGAYDSKWTSVIASKDVSAVGEALMKSMMPSLAPATFQSDSGILAYKLMANDLMIYSPGLAQELNQSVAEQEKQKQAVPKF